MIFKIYTLRKNNFKYTSIFEDNDALVPRRWRSLAAFLRFSAWIGADWLANLVFRIGSRRLQADEVALGEKIFGKSIDFQKIRIHETSIFARNMNVAFVTFNVIHCHSGMESDVFAHELMHVWQYQNMGPSYIAYALVAQRTQEGYNYGGEKYLKTADSIFDFNCEQQAQIVQDYFLLAENAPPQYIAQNQAFLPLFEPFLKEIRTI